MTTSNSESDVIAALRAGDEATFSRLVSTHTPAMLRLARGYVSSTEAAEDVVQESWIALLKGIARFEGRSSLRTWLFAIVINIAKGRGVRDRRQLTAEMAAFTGGTVHPDRFRDRRDPMAGHWKEREEPRPFPETPEGSLLSSELMSVAHTRLDELSEHQRSVVLLRDLLGFDSSEVCALLGITAANQRVLLHRGRAAVRSALEDYLEEKT
ncbi:RNA polymerase sigma factor [Mycolicibacterium mageritense]|uniref:RNA polymerase sigma factor n=1 Tax=Mycolicibacterium mageritense TaxID=53462 RepID=UPI0011DAD086|nr:sigma-70 family RNA polymerase sigma factor [Mycolicibacterium mageritense]TXI55218.1 MAG: sigma-70 family RNA polymerase sigma factor [Mycolicibacterium mageritense]